MEALAAAMPMALALAFIGGVMVGVGLTFAALVFWNREADPIEGMRRAGSPGSDH